MLGKMRRNLDVFHKLCGDNALSAVILGTTKWEEVDTQTGEARERQLRQKFWAGMPQEGSVMRRFESNHTSAWNIVNYLLALKNKIPAIHVHRELVEPQERVPSADAPAGQGHKCPEIMPEESKADVNGAETKRTVEVSPVNEAPLPTKQQHNVEPANIIEVLTGAFNNSDQYRQIPHCKRSKSQSQGLLDLFQKVRPCLKL
jgi:hypothetical protein